MSEKENRSNSVPLKKKNNQMNNCRINFMAQQYRANGRRDKTINVTLYSHWTNELSHQDDIIIRIKTILWVGKNMLVFTSRR